MPIDPLLTAILVIAPVLYAWWSGRRLARSLDDPALPELLQARMQRLGQVTALAVALLIFLPTSALVGIPLLLFALLAVRYPLRRVIYNETWSFGAFLRFFVFAFLGSSLWLFVVLAPQIIVALVEGWAPHASTLRLALAGALGTVAAAIFLAWHRRHSTVWLAMHQGSPLAESTTPAHAALVPRFDAVIDRSGDRLRKRPTIHRYGPAGGHVANAMALISEHEPAVAMSDTLLSALDADEATAIFAHEIAHHELHDAGPLRAQRRSVLLVALLLAVTPVAQLATDGAGRYWVSVVFFLCVLAVFARRRKGLQAAETTCDRRAAELTGDPEAVIRALVKIHVLARMPRRWAHEMERAATHPSLARRIQAIRAAAGTEAASEVLDAPVVVSSTTAGAFVALDDARAHWFEGVPPDSARELSALRERAGSYRAIAYRDLSALRIVHAESGHVLQATDLAGRTWSVALGANDVATVQAALDVVDTRLGRRAAQPVVQRGATARGLAVVMVLVASMAGVLGFLAIPTLVSLIAPSAASLASMAAMAIGWLVLSLVSDAPRESLELAALVATALAGAGAAWLAFAWHRVRAGAPNEGARRGALLTIGLLAAAVAVLALSLASVTSESPRDLAANPRAASLAVVLFGLGAALLTMRHRAWRVAGSGALAVAALGTTAILAGDRLWPSPSDVAWSAGSLTQIGSVPLPVNVMSVELSPRGTRYLARRIGEYDEESGPTGRFETGDVTAHRTTRRFEAIDAALVSESELLVLSQSAGDSIEVRLERLDADTNAAVAWRRRIPQLREPRLSLHEGSRRWQVGGRREAGSASRYVTASGAIGGGDIAHTEVPLDSLRGITLYTFADGSALMSSVTLGAVHRTSSQLSMVLMALGGSAIDWSLWRYERDGRHLVGHVRGALTCAEGAEQDVALCVDASQTGARVWRVARSGPPVSVASFSGRFDRASAASDGRVVVSSYRDRSVAVVDVAARRGVRAAVPKGEYEYAMNVSTNPAGLAVLLRGGNGSRLVLYRLDTNSGLAAR